MNIVLNNLNMAIFKFKREYENLSPVVKIQSLYRGYKGRSFSKKLKKDYLYYVVRIQKMIKGVVVRIRLKQQLRRFLEKKNEDFLLINSEDMIHHNSCIKIQRQIR